MAATKKKTETKKKTATKKAVKTTKAKTTKKTVAKKSVTVKNGEKGDQARCKKDCNEGKSCCQKACCKKERPCRSKTVKKTTKKAAVAKAIIPAPSGAITPVTEKPKAVVPVVEKPKAIQPVAKTEKAARDKSFNPQVFEKKWQAKWEADGLYRAVIDESKPKHYALTMLPYPSGDLHIGHWFSMVPPDTRARFKRMQGFNVLFPMGFDAFGLNAENAAIKDGIHPMKRTFANIERMRKQMRSMGAMFDWEREAVSAEPGYYKWTEWFFIQLYKAGLAYRKMSAVDWCPKDNTTLAREQVMGREPCLRTMRHARRQKGVGAMVLQSHEICR
jgi:hypothetical protein